MPRKIYRILHIPTGTFLVWPDYITSYRYKIAELSSLKDCKEYIADVVENYAYSHLWLEDEYVKCVLKQYDDPSLYISNFKFYHPLKLHKSEFEIICMNGV